MTNFGVAGFLWSLCWVAVMPSRFRIPSFKAK